MMIKRRQHGMTLTELLVAIGLTIMMLAATAMVFNSSTQAASKARAHNEIMQQLRAVTAQLERDFAGLRPDMPMAALFDNSGQYNLRRDRIVFFANGDFQTNMPPGWSPVTLSSNLARIYYGQDINPLANPNTDELGPDRWILTRREKLLTSDYSIRDAGGTYITLPPQGSAWRTSGVTQEFYDSLPFEHSTVSYWRNVDTATMPNEFTEHYFNTDPSDYNDSIASMMRAVNMTNVNLQMQNNIIDYNALQRLYVLPDVSDLKIQFWIPSSGRWFPDELDFSDYLNPTVFASSNQVKAFAFYWNAGDIDTDPAEQHPIQDESLGSNARIDWWSQADIANKAGLTNNWPTAIKFTFTLYDGGRRYFPEGRTFNYIIKLPERK